MGEFGASYVSHWVIATIIIRRTIKAIIIHKAIPDFSCDGCLLMVVGIKRTNKSTPWEGECQVKCCEGGA